MRIAWVSHRDIYHPKAGGAERTALELGKRLVLMGHEFSWYSVSPRMSRESLSIEGIKISRFPGNFLSHIVLPFIVLRKKPDVIVEDLGHVVPWLFERFSRIPGTAMFYHLHRRALVNQLNLPLRTVLFALEDSYPLIFKNWPIVTDSKSAAIDLIQLGISRERISVIPLGVNSDFFIKKERSEKPQLIYFGGMRDYKRPWEVIYALEKIKKTIPEIRLIMVGDGPSKRKLTLLSKRLQLDDLVEFTGRLEERTLQNIVAESWVNIHTSKTEGFGLSIVEASASGTPTVAYRVPGVSEIIEEGKNGLLVPDGDRELLVESILKILQSFSQLDWAENSIKVALKYSWNKAAKAWENHLERVAHSKEEMDTVF